MADILSKLSVIITANTAQMVSALANGNKSVALLDSTLRSLKNQLIGTFGAYQIVNGIRNAISTIAEFEKQMDKVRAITGATGTEFDKLEKNALDLGRSTEYTARQIAGLQVEYGRLGFSSREILNSTKATLNLATATGEDLARSAEIAGATLRAFQLDASEMGRVTDVMTGVLNQSALALDSFADGMKYVAPVAEATNVTLDETSALLGILADAGIKGSQAGTSLRRIFTLLDRSGKPVVERLKELAAQGITLAAANDEVGLYAQTALLVITKQIDRFEELTTVLENLNGEAERTAEIMRDNLSGDFDKLKSAMEGVVLEGSKMNPMFRAVTQSATDFFTVMADRGFVSAVGRTGFLAGFFGEGLEDVVKEIEAARKLQEEFDKKTAESIDRQAKQGLETFGTTVKGLEALKAAYSSNVNGLEIYKRAVEFAKDALKKETEAQLEATRAKLEAIAAREKEFQLLRQKRNAEFEGLKEGGLPELDFSKAFNPDLFNNPKLRGLLDEDTQRLAQEAADNYDLVFDRIVDGAERATAATGASIQEWVRFAEISGAAISQAIANDESLAKSAAAVTADILDASNKRIAAYLGEGIAKAFAINPIAGAAIATVGLAAISGLLRKYAKSSNGTSAGGASTTRATEVAARASYGAAQSSAPSPVLETQVRGQDLWVVLKNYESTKKSTHG